MPWRCIGGVNVQLHSFFDLCTRWSWVVSFTPQPLYPQGKSPWYPLDRKLGGPQSWYECGVEEKNSHPCLDPSPVHLAHSPALYHWVIPAEEEDLYIVPCLIKTSFHFNEKFRSSTGFCCSYISLLPQIFKQK
jgi:hypothetical protein